MFWLMNTVYHEFFFFLIFIQPLFGTHYEDMNSLWAERSRITLALPDKPWDMISPLIVEPTFCRHLRSTFLVLWPYSTGYLSDTGAMNLHWSSHEWPNFLVLFQNITPTFFLMKLLYFQSYSFDDSLWFLIMETSINRYVHNPKHARAHVSHSKCWNGCIFVGTALINSPVFISSLTD